MNKGSEEDYSNNFVLSSYSCSNNNAWACFRYNYKFIQILDVNKTDSGSVTNQLINAKSWMNSTKEYDVPLEIQLVCYAYHRLDIYLTTINATEGWWIIFS